MNYMPAGQMGLRAQRAVGRLDLSFRAVGGVTRVERMGQLGCLKALLPRAAEAGACEVVVLNIGGGVVGGDDLGTVVEVGGGARLRFATQAAERVYRAVSEPARVAARVVVGEGAMLDYLPQETILFDGFSLRRNLDIELGEDSDFLGVESLVFGRQAMGEVVRCGWLRDRVRLVRCGRLVWQDMTRLDGDVAGVLARGAVAGGAVAVAVIVFAAPGGGAKLAGLRQVLEGFGLVAGASLIDGVLVCRILAPDSAVLRRCVVAGVKFLRDGRPVPRVWQG